MEKTMRSTLLSRYRRWIGASALAILVGLGGGSAFLAASSPSALAQVQNAAAIDVPAVSQVTGFADLVDAVQPAVVSITVESDVPREGMLRGGQRGREFNFQFPDLPDDHPFKDFFEQFGDQFGREFGGQNGEGPRQPRAPRHQIIATHAAVMTVQNAFKAVAFAAFGFAFASYLPLVAAMIASGLIGTTIGGRLLKGLPEARFRLGFKLTLTAIALSLLWTAAFPQP